MINHIEIYVGDLRRSEEFWGWLLPQLEYREFQRWESGVSYKCDEHYIVFVQTEEAFLQHGYHRKRIGLNHLAFSVPSKEDVDRLRDALQSTGTRLLYDERYPNAGGGKSHAVFCEDPDGIKVEVVWRKPKVREDERG